MEQMVKLTEDLSEEFDYIILDCPQVLNRALKIPLPAGQIVVTTPEFLLPGRRPRAHRALQANEMPQIQLVINRLRPDMIQRGEMMSVENVSRNSW